MLLLLALWRLCILQLWGENKGELFVTEYTIDHQRHLQGGGGGKVPNTIMVSGKTSTLVGVMLSIKKHKMSASEVSVLTVLQYTK